MAATEVYLGEERKAFTSTDFLGELSPRRGNPSTSGSIFDEAAYNQGDARPSARKPVIDVGLPYLGGPGNVSPGHGVTQPTPARITS